MRWRLALPLALTLCSCGPKLKGSVDRIAGRSVIVENTDTSSFTIQRIVANGSPENSSCNDYPNKSLAPGESYSTTFLVCGPVHEFRVETDRGSASVNIGAGI